MRLLRAIELPVHFRKIGDWVDWDDTCDEFLAGDACAEVRGIAVSWMPTFRNLESALASGCKLFVTHEPLYVSDMDSSGLIGPEDAWVMKKA